MWLLYGSQWSVSQTGLDWCMLCYKVYINLNASIISNQHHAAFKAT